MATFRFELVSPESLLVSEEVEAVKLPGSEGEFQVLAGHAPFLALLGPGIVEVTGGEAGQKRFFIDGGFCDVNLKGCSVLAEAAFGTDQAGERLDAIIEDAQAAASALENAATLDEANRRIATLQSLKTAL